MTTNLDNVPVETAEKRPDAAPPPVPHAGFEPGVRPPDPGPLDWGCAVGAAAARLEESWVRPDLTGHMLASGLADELAATLCAYGMVAGEVAHMHEHDDDVPASDPPRR